MAKMVATKSKMLSRETLMVGILAIFAGLIAAAGVRSYLAGLEELPQQKKEIPPQTYRVPVAATDLPADRIVSKHDVISLLPMTREEITLHYPKVNLNQLLINSASILNRQLKEPMKSGEPFLTTKFYLSGTGPSIAKKLQPGYRAIRVQVPVNREAAVRPGMSVEVFFRAKSQTAKSGQLPIPEKTLTLFKHIDVLEAERPGAFGRAGGKSRDKWTFTLAVPESKADFFSIIEDRGELWLVPTPAEGDELADGATTEVADVSTLSELLGITAPRQPPPPFETAIYRRDKIQVNKFVDGKLVTSRFSDLGAKLDRNKLAPAGDSPAALPEEKE